jgi:hypothetical protein
VLREITHSADRSSLFWWMVENHDELANAANGRRLQWTRLCAQFAELGLTDANGNPASEWTARKTWERARRAVAKARELAAAKREAMPKRKYPSRVSPDWRPQVVEQSGLAASPARRSPSSWSGRVSSTSEAHGLATDELGELPTVDPSGAPLQRVTSFIADNRCSVGSRNSSQRLVGKRKRWIGSSEKGSTESPLGTQHRGCRSWTCH